MRDSNTSSRQVAARGAGMVPALPAYTRNSLAVKLPKGDAAR